MADKRLVALADEAAAADEGDPDLKYAMQLVRRLERAVRELVVDKQRLEREVCESEFIRDEARAEVERLRGELEKYQESDIK